MTEADPTSNGDVARPNLYPDVMKGRSAYREFAASAKLDLRYFRGGQGQKFLDHLAETHRDRVLAIPEGDSFWRARLGRAFKEGVISEDGKIQLIGDIETPLPTEEMGAPPFSKATDGRVNPRGISYLYMATNPQTAIAEIRPWLDAKISIGRLSRSVCCE
jgi:hypothetical protein